MKEQEAKQEELQEKINRTKLSSEERIPVTESSSGSTHPYLSNQESGDMHKVDEYTKELNNFFAKLKLRSFGNPAEGEDGLIKNMTSQLIRLRSDIGKSPNAVQKKQGYKNILSVAKRTSDAYIQKNMQFLIDNGFRRKIAYLMKFDSKNYSDVINTFKRDINDKFFSAIESNLSKHFNLDPQTEDKEELEAAQEVFIDRLSNMKEKIYALYNNKIDLMDVFNQTFFALYLLKGLRIFFIWLAVYMASKIMQEKYVNKVFANNEDPPDLKMFVLIYFGIESALIVALLVFLALVSYVFDKHGDFIINNNLITKFVIDHILSTMVILGLSMILSAIVMKKKYFRYKTDGLRAIRGMQELVFYCGSIVSAIPFFMMV